MDKSVKDRTIEFVKYKGITMKTFEIRCGLSSGYVTSMRKGFGSDKLSNVLTAFPELNRDWLLYGEGEMLKSNISQTSHGNNSPNIAGNGNNINTSPNHRSSIVSHKNLKLKQCNNFFLFFFTNSQTLHIRIRLVGNQDLSHIKDYISDHVVLPYKICLFLS